LGKREKEEKRLPERGMGYGKETTRKCSHNERNHSPIIPLTDFKNAGNEATPVTPLI
jgi:hypothetical protein